MNYILLFFSFLISWSVPDREPSGRWLVELASVESDCLDHWWEEQGLNRSGAMKKKLPLAHWSVIEIPSRYVAAIKNLSCVMNLREDQRIEWRDTEPNDPAYINQVDMELIGMPKAWDFTRGGVTSRGDTIVVAIIDTGFDPNHVDLKDNIWKNREEIPNDNIDNDQNGYIDDYLGLNISTGNDEHLPVNQHGTSVSGIIGAKGNNEIGIAGINWDVKMMLVSGADFESELIEAYEYVLEFRKKYNQTNGAEGAFVVVTNLSGGINNAFAQDHPLWCDMYNKMGAEGILSVTAAPNQSISVDQDGDMPTTCTSPFMITVTNVDLTDEIVGNAGYGPISIDIGAPGHGTLTTAGNNQYREFPGTSAATPHVTGTVALMYSTPCSTFLQNLDSDPDGVALMIKDFILDSGTDNNSLEDITVTGKRLQTDAAVRSTLMSCDNTVTEAVRIISVQPNPITTDFAEVYFEVRGDTSTAFLELYNSAGSRVNTFDISGPEYEQGYVRIKTSPLAAGIYFVSLWNKKEVSTSRLFVK